MSSTVTTTTVTAVTTATLATSLSLILIITLLLLLINKEIISTSSYPWADRLNRTLNIAIVPLFAIFVLTLLMRIYDVIG